MGWMTIPIGSMYAIYGNIYHQYTIHGSYGINHIPSLTRILSLRSGPMVGSSCLRQLTYLWHGQDVVMWWCGDGRLREVSLLKDTVDRWFIHVYPCVIHVLYIHIYPILYGVHHPFGAGLCSPRYQPGAMHRGLLPGPLCGSLSARRTWQGQSFTRPVAAEAMAHVT